MINNITQHFTRNSAITSSKHRIASINSILIAFFKKFFILISKPVYTITPNGIKISILYFLPNKPRRALKSLVWGKGKKQSTRARRPVSLKTRKLAYWNQFITKITPGTTEVIVKKETRFQRSRITFLVLLLSKLLQTNVQLELVRLKYVYHDSNILAQFLGINSHKNTYARFKNLLWQRVTTLSVKDNSLLNTTQDSPVTQLTGFKIKISGRLAKQRVIPKKTVKSTYKGAISPNKNNLVQEATFTGKNKKGAYSIRVWTSHGTTPKA